MDGDVSHRVCHTHTQRGSWIKKKRHVDALVYGRKTIGGKHKETGVEMERHRLDDEALLRRRGWETERPLSGEGALAEARLPSASKPGSIQHFCPALLPQLRISPIRR